VSTLPPLLMRTRVLLECLEEDNGRSARSVRDLSCLWPRPPFQNSPRDARSDLNRNRQATSSVWRRRRRRAGSTVRRPSPSTAPRPCLSRLPPRIVTASRRRDSFGAARSQAPKCRRHKTEPQNVGVWLSLVVHLVRDEGVAGSNPATPTNRSIT
jgi:hypothetical protein